MIRHWLFLFIFVCNLQVFSKEYPYNPHVPIEVWTMLEPYFLPTHHPIRKKLDALFSKQRATLSLKTFEKAGFGKQKLRQPTNIIVGRHADFSSYLFKVYLDSQPAVVEWDNWIKRIEGAKAIESCCQAHEFSHFVVPQKWIYPLPLNPSPPLKEAYARKNFILIVEEIPILHQKENENAYLKKITPQILDELYVILSETQAIDSVYIDNIPFTRSGKIAFVDTEHHHAGQVPFHKLTPRLNPKMQNYWQTLIQN